MPDPDPLHPPALESRALLVVVALASLLFALILWPFFGAVCWAVFIAIVFWPLHQRFLNASRDRPNLAAVASVSSIVLIVILPLAFVAASVVREATAMAARLRAGEIQIGAIFQRFLGALPDWARRLLEHFDLADLALLQEKLLATLGESSSLLTSRALGLGQVTLDLAVGFFVMLYVVYFLFRDGRSLVGEVERRIPLQPQQTQRLLTQFTTVVRATVKGNILVALVQGTLGGLAFWVLGLPGAVLWGAVMALLSLLPAVGAVLVWAPVAAYYFLSGDLVRAVGLVLWGSLVIGLVDNLLRPILVGKDTRLPDYLVLVATLGGIVVFGISGFVIGPVIAAVFLVSWDMLAVARATRQEPAAPDAHP